MTLHRFTFRAMAAENEIQVHTATPVHADAAARFAIAEVNRIESKYSRYKPDSLLSRINSAAGKEHVEIDDETRKLLVFADACHRQSGGLFDITSGVLRRAWRFEEGSTVPSDDELRPLLSCIGWPRVTLDASGSIPAAPRMPPESVPTTAFVRPRVRLEEGMEIDFGGFGKEYAVDRAAVHLRDAGITSGMVNLAGDLLVLGPQPDGSPWRVGIRHPRTPGALIAQVPVFSGAIATSGDYERYIEVDGVRHCHVLDPRNGRSVRGFQSVTVHAPSCLVAGSASTIAMLKGARDGLEWLRSLGVAHLAVLEDGTVVDRMGEEGRGL
jgi:thiamine biosynthesis lipoprotein